MSGDPKQEIIRRLERDPVLAHSVLFKHRHNHRDAPFHPEMIRDIHSDQQKLLVMAFRGAAKSTRVEEAMTVMAIFEKFNNGLIIGESFDRGCERLSSIKHELETNELILELFGDLRGDTWTENKIVLADGRCIQALGRGQSLRGTKHLNFRPDFCFLDDVEDEESVETREARAKNKKWLLRVVIPGLDSTCYRIRMAATPLHPESLPMVLQKDRSWKTRIYPIEYIDDAGARTSSWPDREPLEVIDQRKAEFERLGEAIGYAQEYMCEAEAENERVFLDHMFRVEPQIRTWQAVYAMFDPARTTNTTSATTGIAVWSWINNRLIVWEARGEFYKPDEIVSEIFNINARYNPVWIGVERDGLEEWLMQPIRQETLKRMVMPPVRSISAPKGKLEFIKGLQPFFKAQEVIFANDMPAAKAQFLSFPRGKIDVPNALAYALRMRSGGPVYENFSLASVVPGLEPVRGKPVYLAVNANSTLVTGILVQFVAGAMRILADFVVGSPPLEAFGQLVRDARLECPEAIRVVCGESHFAKYRNLGLVQSAKRIPVEVKNAPAPERGRGFLNEITTRQYRGMPALLISDRARFVLNGLSGGYCYEAWRYGVSTPDIEENLYSTLIQGLESFCALLDTGSTDEDQSDKNYSISRDGRRYVSAFRRD